MKMNFNIMARYQGLCQAGIIIVLLMLASPIYADLTVNNSKKDDKIESNSSIPVIDAGQQTRSNPAPARQTNDVSKIWELRAEQWELARSGESILMLPVLHQLINTWLSQRRMKIELRYPGGEEGEFWVQELTDWLVALGIPSNHIVSIPGSGADDRIKFALIK
jgi:hypothetical protein